MSSSSASSDSSAEMSVAATRKTSTTACRSPNSNLPPKPPTQAPESSGSEGSGSDSDDDGKDNGAGVENSSGTDDDKDDDEGGEKSSGSDGSGSDDGKDDDEGGEKSSGSDGSGSDDDGKDDDESGEKSSGSDGSGSDDDDKDEDEGGEKSSGSDGSGSDSDGNEPTGFKTQHPPIVIKSSGSEDDHSGSDDQPAPLLGPSARVRSSSIKAKALTTMPVDDHKKVKLQEEEQQQQGGGGSQKRLPFQRIWTEDDEIALLQGLIHYQENNGHGSVPATADMGAFHELLRESLSVDVSNTQLSDKVRSLKKKYFAAVARGKYVMEPSLVKSHDRHVFELSKQIWPAGKNVPFSVSGCAADEFTDDDDHVDVTVKRRKINPEPRSLDNSDGTAVEHDGGSPYTLLTEMVSIAGNKQTASTAREAVKMLGPLKVDELVAKYNKLTLLEMKNNLGRMDLLKESVKLFMDALEKMV